MTTAITTQSDHAQIDRAMEWLMRLPKLPPSEWPEMGEVKATVAALSEPVSPAWCMARIAALLNPYYDKDTPPAVRKMEAEDWLEELQSYPQWAIERAVRWWKSADNPDRRKKPLEGDIAARCKVEMRGIGSLPEILERKASGRWIAPLPPRPAESKEDRQAAAEKILAEAGFTVKKPQDNLQ